MKEFQLSVLLHGIWASDGARVENTSTLVSIRSREWANYPGWFSWKQCKQADKIPQNLRVGHGRRDVLEAHVLSYSNP